jgi:hypothetical protein
MHDKLLSLSPRPEIEQLENSYQGGLDRLTGMALLCKSRRGLIYGKSIDDFLSDAQ